MLIIDKFILRRPSLQELGVINEVSTVLTNKEELDKMCGNNTDIENYDIALNVINGKQPGNIVNYDKIPKILLGIIAHKASSDKLELYSIDYFKKLDGELELFTLDGNYSLTVNGDSYNITNFEKLCEDESKWEYGYEFDSTFKAALPVQLYPSLKVGGATKYIRGRILIPVFKIKHKYEPLLVVDVIDYNGVLDTAEVPKFPFTTIDDGPRGVPVMSYMQTKELESSKAYKPTSGFPMTKEPAKNSELRISPDSGWMTMYPKVDSFENPVFLATMFGMRYLEDDKLAYQAHLANITDEDRKRFETDNDMRILVCKLALGLVIAPL